MHFLVGLVGILAGFYLAFSSALKNKGAGVVAGLLILFFSAGYLSTL